MKRSILWIFTAVVFFAGMFSVQAKRGAPPVFEPVVIDSVRYSAPADPESMGFVIASDDVSGRELWRKRIYRIFINPILERDVQWVFITSLNRQGDALAITNERGEKFRLDLSTRKVRRVK